MVPIKTSDEIEMMRRSCKLAANLLQYAQTLIRPGITTEEINQRIHRMIIAAGAYPSPLNYHGFPKSICTSRNEVICHGIPSAEEVLCEGDIVNIDITTLLDGFHGDTNATFLVGNVNPAVAKLVKVTQQAMMQGIRQVRPQAQLGDVGAAIEECVRKHGFSVVHEYCGHGIGRAFHEEPQVLHYGKAGTGMTLRPGMVFTIEPMINLGKRHCQLLADGWTVVTRDGKPSAQFEHTLAVTTNGYEILTLPDENWQAQLPSLD